MRGKDQKFYIIDLYHSIMNHFYVDPFRMYRKGINARSTELPRPRVNFKLIPRRRG